MRFQMARSLAGHDKDSLYIVTAEDNDLLSLCDGRLRPLSKPKKKKRKHVQPIIHIPPDIEALTEGADEWDDALIRKVIAEYDHCHRCHPELSEMSS